MILDTKMVFKTRMFFIFLVFKMCVITNPHLWTWISSWLTRRLKRTQDKLDSDLELAVQKGDLTEMLKLLKRGANPNKIDNEGYNSLHIAVRRGHSKLLQHLVKYGADLEREGKAYGYKPLHLLVSGNNKMECLEELLNCGVDLKSTDWIGNTLLQLMVKRHPNEVNFIKKLLSLGMNPHTFDIIGNNCLHNLAATHLGEDKNVEILAEIFIESGTDMNCRNRTMFETPLMVALRRDKAFLVDLLLRKGATINAMNIQRWTFYDDYMGDLKSSKREVPPSYPVSYYSTLCPDNLRVAKYSRNAKVRGSSINHKSYGMENYVREIKYEI